MIATDPSQTPTEDPRESYKQQLTNLLSTIMNKEIQTFNEESSRQLLESLMRSPAVKKIMPKIKNTLDRSLSRNLQVTKSKMPIVLREASQDIETPEMTKKPVPEVVEEDAITREAAKSLNLQSIMTEEELSSKDSSTLQKLFRG